MEIYTLSVGQGQFVVVAGKREAFVVDTFTPLESAQETVFVKAALSKILAGKKLCGLLVTGFDADHFCDVGVKIVLNKYRPDWLMYPRYLKKTSTADSCFATIEALTAQQGLKRCSVVIKDHATRFYNKLCDEFTFEIFSPHPADMNSSNNCSIVTKVTEVSTGATYLITGDTENDRWASIVKDYGPRLKADVLAAPHHGSENGITEDVLKKVQPHTVLVSAGVKSQYGHPHAKAVGLFRAHAHEYWCTNTGEGQSLKTVVDGGQTKTFKFLT